MNVADEKLYAIKSVYFFFGKSEEEAMSGSEEIGHIPYFDYTLDTEVKVDQKAKNGQWFRSKNVYHQIKKFRPIKFILMKIFDNHHQTSPTYNQFQLIEFYGRELM